MTLSLEARAIIQELNEIILKLKDKSLKIGSWHSCFDLPGYTASFEWINRGHRCFPTNRHQKP